MNELSFEAIGKVEQGEVLGEHAVATNDRLEPAQVTTLGVGAIELVGDVAMPFAGLV